jgi:endonuclease/exonuclease/phosphatase family metal-dependent hydrolase
VGAGGHVRLVMKLRPAVSAVALSILAASTLPALGCSSAPMDEGAPPAAGDSATPEEGASELGAAARGVAGAGSPWTSPEACESAVAKGRLAPRRKGAARVVAWNVRWFPDGVMPTPGAVKKPTNIDWLACSVAWLDADVIALEEVLNHPDAKLAMDKLVARLNVLTGGDWHADVDPCPQPRAQHQGLLYDANKTTVTTPHRFDWRPGDWCNLSVRPAWTGYVKTTSGLDFHLAAVHTKSGVDARSFGLRQETLARLPELVADTQNSVADSDVIVAGDFNTMGSTAAGAPVTPEEEIGQLDAEIAPSGFSRVPADSTCSEYSGSRRHLLDHFLTSGSMKEVPSTAKTIVSGYCAALACGAMPSTAPRAHTEISDHCPVVLDLDGRDLD